MKIALIQLPHPYEGTFRPPTLYPLGLGYLTSVLARDHEVIPVDLWVDEVSVPDAVHRIVALGADVFCISVYSTQYPYFKALTAALKRSCPAIPIIAGGPGATFSASVILERTPTDLCVIGEGERTLPAVLASLRDWEGISGIAFRRGNKAVFTAPREQIDDLDQLPLPDRSVFDIQRYIRNSTRQPGLLQGYRSTNVIAGRGCPYLCTFCSKTFEGVRVRSIAAIERELKDIIPRFGLNAIEFNDELVILNKQRALDLCRILEPLGIAWGCQGRINIVDEEILVAMKKAGCVFIGYGVESYTQSILDDMKKAIKVEKIVPVIEMTRKIGIHPIIQYMFGYPGENDRSIEHTKTFFRMIDHPYVGFTTTPLPGTDLYARARREGKIPDEEAYLDNLTSGYNRWGPLVNMTGYSTDEFIASHKALMDAVNSAYYARHPIARLRVLLRRVRYLLMFMLRRPGSFFNKLMSRISVRNGRKELL